MMLATTPQPAPLVSLDLETTGLTPARDRIVQIGAITESPARHFDMLVNPGVMQSSLGGRSGSCHCLW